MRLVRLSVLASAALLTPLFGCTSDTDTDTQPEPHVAYDGTPLVDGFDPPAPPDDALQLVSPIIRDVEPGANRELCYYTKHILSESTAFRAGQGFQHTGGHHVVVYWTTETEDEDIHECTEADMTKLHVLSGGGAEAGNGIVNELPAGGAFHVPAGAQLVMNVHVLNASDKAVDTQAVANLYYGDESLAPLTSFYVTGTTLKVDPHAQGSFTTSCVAPRDFQVVRLLGHMHEWGSNLVITLDDGSGPEMVYDKPGSDEFSYNPPYIDYPTTAPLVVKAGTTITATCTYQNNEDKPLTFPTEMCAAFGYILGTEAEFGCSDNVWNNQ
ncbi:MAG: hypothetical protein U0271_41130 [Polyangiaceae bacterium]